MVMATADEVKVGKRDAAAALVEGVDFYLEGAAVVFTEGFLRRRGYCCESGCRHCPYRGKSEDSAGAEKEAEDKG